jgi:hypothetical protein
MPGDEHASWCLYEVADEDDADGEEEGQNSGIEP